MALVSEPPHVRRLDKLTWPGIIESMATTSTPASGWHLTPSQLANGVGVHVPETITGVIPGWGDALTPFTDFGPNADVRLVVVDTETTGFNPADGAQVTEIGWVCLNTGASGAFVPAHTLNGASEQALNIQQYHTRLAGLPQDDGTAVVALHAFLGGDRTRTHLVGSNPAFDALHLNALFTRHGLSPDPWHHRLIDAAAATYWLDPTQHTGHPTGLDSACTYAGIANPGAHSALADAYATAWVWLALEYQRHRLPRPDALNDATDAMRDLWQRLT